MKIAHYESIVYWQWHDLSKHWTRNIKGLYYLSLNSFEYNEYSVCKVEIPKALRDYEIPNIYFHNLKDLENTLNGKLS